MTANQDSRHCMSLDSFASDVCMQRKLISALLRRVVHRLATALVCKLQTAAETSLLVFFRATWSLQTSMVNHRTVTDSTVRQPGSDLPLHAHRRRLVLSSSRVGAEQNIIPLYRIAQKNNCTKFSAPLFCNRSPQNHAVCSEINW